ncbi:MAG: PepSY domain-containing protein [Gammaproteobacteria bacterium]|nr:PepSY domain-containing protein [Gammaproteobacteria bacterium]
MNRVKIINLHLILAAVLLPAILMFAITGGFYTWGVKGGYDSQSYKLPLANPLGADLGSLVQFAQAELDKQNQAYPTGGAKLKSNEHTHILEWTGSNLDISLSTDKGSSLATLQVKQTSPYRQLVQLHKAKGGTVFKIYAALVAIGLLVILFSGVLMGVTLTKYRQTTVLALLAGTGLWVLAVVMS